MFTKYILLKYSIYLVLSFVTILKFMKQKRQFSETKKLYINVRTKELQKNKRIKRQIV